jgi:hypothetical protein
LILIRFTRENLPMPWAFATSRMKKRKPERLTLVARQVF